MFGSLKAKLIAFAGGFLVVAGIVLAAFLKGRAGAKKEDAATAQAVHDHEIVRAAEVAQATQDDAAAAVKKVAEKEAAASAPDVKARDDFEGTQ